MPSYVYTWDETKPAGSRALSLGDDDIREFKAAIRERFATDHKAAADETAITTIGYHLKTTLIDLAGNPTAVGSAGIVFAKTVTGRVELCYMDDAGNVIQLTSSGKLVNYGVTGDWQLSSVTTGRTGWTNVSATYSNKFMRINATPLTTGGTDTHTHGVGSYAGTISGNTGAVNQAADVGGGAGTSSNQSSHTHSAGSLAAAMSGTSASGDNVPAYVQVAVFQKD